MTTHDAPIQTTGAKRSRSKGQQVHDLMCLIDAQLQTYNQRKPNDTEIDLLPVVEVIRLADKLRELIRIPR